MMKTLKKCLMLKVKIKIKNQLNDKNKWKMKKMLI